MIRIAICDDESVFRDKLSKSVCAYEELPDDTSVRAFSSGQELIDSHIKDVFHIIFLDVEMPELSGFEVAEKIRKLDRSVIIIFVTSHQQLMFKSFKLDAFDYIVKPIKSCELNDVLCRAFVRYREQHYIVCFKWDNESYALDVSSIVYLESYRRNVLFKTVDALYKCVGKLGDYERQLIPYGFLRCHQRFLVNMSYVKRIESETVLTTEGHLLQMSTRKRQDCMNAFNAFFVRHKI
ncbi:MAG: LytTR family DNA-binding domain-containing protein [Oscillospiraceae bacterium]|nr:LytTR family DNA-binding domain-containing protein [Oscillospiraceae bacterium]